jgi:hypothetical protein
MTTASAAAPARRNAAVSQCFHGLPVYPGV